MLQWLPREKCNLCRKDIRQTLEIKDITRLPEATTDSYICLQYLCVIYSDPKGSFQETKAY